MPLFSVCLSQSRWSPAWQTRVCTEESAFLRERATAATAHRDTQGKTARSVSDAQTHTSSGIIVSVADWPGRSNGLLGGQRSSCPLDWEWRLRSKVRFGLWDRGNGSSQTIGSFLLHSCLKQIIIQSLWTEISPLKHVKRLSWFHHAKKVEIPDTDQRQNLDCLLYFMFIYIKTQQKRLMKHCNRNQTTDLQLLDDCFTSVLKYN